MAEDGFALIYLIFFLIPLARILPRIIRKLRNKTQDAKPKTYTDGPMMGQMQESFAKPPDAEMMVLGTINSGNKNFNGIQKNTGLNKQELEDVLKKLEEHGLIKVVQKGGLFGMKVEIHPTEKGQKKYYT